MSTKTSECLAAAGIKTIIWIDDHYSNPTRDDHVSDIQRDVEKLKAEGKQNVDLRALEAINLGQSITRIKDLVDDVLEPMKDEEVGILARQIASLTGANTSNLDVKEDLSDPDFKALEDAFGSGLRKFCLKTWSTSPMGTASLDSYSEDTLFLIDREFHRESGSLGGTDGIELLSEVVNRSSAFFILLTHTCTEQAEEELRVTIATSKKIEPHRFSVLSKLQNKNLSMDARFACAVRAVMTHKFSGETASFISKIIKATADETAKTLAKQSFPELDQALFINAYNEGVFEYDAILRVFGIEQNHALNLALKDEKIQNQLRAARKFREAIFNLGLKKPNSDMSYFKELHRREIFSEGDGLNQLHAPLSCGDVFKDDDENQFVFLIQPCDLMVRKNGKRKAEVGFMVRITNTPPDEEEAQLPDYRFYDLNGLLEDGKISLVDLREFFVVDLSILDFSVFNEDGRVELRRNHKEPTIILTKGWSLRMSNASARIFADPNPPKLQNLCIGEYASKLAGSIKEDSLRYPLRRIGRLESNTASAILVAWATFQTRAAFDHDFAQVKIKKPVKSPKPEAAQIITESDMDNLSLPKKTSEIKEHGVIRRMVGRFAFWIGTK